MVKKTKKNHSMILRLDDEQNEMLENYAEISGITKTELIRNSITNGLLLNTHDPEYPNPKSIFSQSMIHYLFDKCSESELLELAQISYDLSKNEMDELEKRGSKLSDLDKEHLDFFASYLAKYVFGTLGHAWFDECRTNVRGKYVYFYGWHNCGPNFHVFVEYLLNFYFELVGYEIKTDSESLEYAKKKADEFDYRKIKRRFYKFSVKLGPIKK